MKNNSRKLLKDSDQNKRTKETQQLYIKLYIHVFLCNVEQGFSLALRGWFIGSRDVNVTLLIYPLFDPLRLEKPRTVGS